jgi:hypothetical protein
MIHRVNNILILSEILTSATVLLCGPLSSWR